MTYDVIHFEALGPEAQHLEEEIRQAMKNGDLPADHRYLITSLRLQDLLQEDSRAVLPDLITIKTHSQLPESYLEGVITSYSIHYTKLYDNVYLIGQMFQMIVSRATGYNAFFMTFQI